MPEPEPVGSSAENPIHVEVRQPHEYRDRDKGEDLLGNVRFAYSKAIRYAMNADGLPAEHPLAVKLDEALEAAHNAGIAFEDVVREIETVPLPRY